ncbi:MAG TPA: hypothetical protein V6C52_04875 [Coleofasciculaceae cyanobacterium]
MSKPSQSMEKPLTRPMWWGLFLAATYVMSLWFQTFKVFTVTPTLTNGLGWLGVNLLLLLIVMTLIYDSYVQEKGRGRIEKPIRLFEWMHRRAFLLRSNLRQKGDLS